MAGEGTCLATSMDSGRPRGKLGIEKERAKAAREVKLDAVGGDESGGVVFAGGGVGVRGCGG